MRQIYFSVVDRSEKVRKLVTLKQGENISTELYIDISNEFFVGHNYKLIFQLNNDTPILTESLIPDGKYIKYALTNALTKDAGMLKLEIHSYDTDGFLIKSITFYFDIESTIDDTETIILPETYVPWYTEVIEKVDYVDSKAEEVSENADKALISETNSKTSETNAKISEDNAKASEIITISKADLATLVAVQVQQTWTDMLAMKGTDFASLVNGKVPVGQLPSIALNVFKFTPATRAEMLALTTVDVQAGDRVKVLADDDGYGRIYELMDEGDPSVYEDWIGFNTNDMLVGHALEADIATVALDAEKVNGHRLVKFPNKTAALLAVKTADDLYFAPILEGE